MIHRRFYEAAALAAAGAGVLALGSAAGERISAGQISLALLSASALVACGAWYRADARRALGEAGHGHVALAVPGAAVMLIGALGLAAGLKTAAPALVIGALTVAVAMLVLIKRARAGARHVRRLVTVSGGDGAPVVTVDYRIEAGR